MFSKMLDADDYLINYLDWNDNIAEQLAISENIQLTKNHQIVLAVLREHYQQYFRLPILRVLIKLLRKDLSDFDSMQFYDLFPQGLPQAVKLAGLPKPARCFKG